MGNEVRMLVNKYDRFSFVWGLTDLLKDGFEASLKITEEHINEAYNAEKKLQSEMPKNAFKIYSPECVKYKFEVQIELAKIAEESIVNLLNQIEECELFSNPKRKVSYSNLISIAYNALTSMKYNDFDPDDGNLINEICDYAGCDVDDLFEIGVINADEVNKYYEEMEDKQW